MLIPFACITEIPLLPIEIRLHHKAAVKSAALVHQSAFPGAKAIVVNAGLVIVAGVIQAVVPDCPPGAGAKGGGLFRSKNHLGLPGRRIYADECCFRSINIQPGGVNQIELAVPAAHGHAAIV